MGLVPRWVFGFNADVPFPLVFGVLGFSAGVIFSGLLILTRSRRGFDQMTLSHFAAWGAAGGLLLSAFFTSVASLDWADMLAITSTFTVACAACAAGSLALARRAGLRKLPDFRGEGGEAELANPETPSLD